jgi:hypothetical protein
MTCVALRLLENTVKTTTLTFNTYDNKVTNIFIALQKIVSILTK